MQKAISPGTVAFEFDDPDGFSEDDPLRDLYLVEHKISYSLAVRGFPSDASAALSEKADWWMNYAVEEILDLPYFCWILVQDIIDADWPQSDDAIDYSNFPNTFPKTWKAWLERMQSIGKPEDLRYVFMNMR